MLRPSFRGLLALTLLVGAAGCAARGNGRGDPVASAGLGTLASTSFQGVASGDPARTVVSAPDPPASASTLEAASETAPTSRSAPIDKSVPTSETVPARATAPTSETVPTSQTVPAGETVPAPTGPPSLPVWSPPADAVDLPRPDGPASVGIAAAGFADTVVFYPAVAGTGRGLHRYVEPEWATVAGLDPALMDRVVSSAQIDATPLPADSPRPIVLLTPGWRSLVAFSTSLAESLASNGYVVLATQTDLVAEWSHPASTQQDRDKRLAVVRRLLDFTAGPSLPKLVGPIDVHRIAVGGHSYAGTIAFDATVADRRIAVVFDLDGSARGEATRTPPTRPTLVVVTVDNAKVADPLLGHFAARSPNIAAVGVLDALHLDVTDAASIPMLLGTSVFSTLVGTVGSSGTTDTSRIVGRFLDATLTTRQRQPTGAELVGGLPSATADPFGSQAPAGPPVNPPA